MLQNDVLYFLLKKNLGENLDLTGIRVTATGKFPIFSIIYYKDRQRRLYNVDLEVMKQCRPALAQTGKCQRIDANNSLQSLKNMPRGAGIRYQIV